ncbi:hypothetical protein VNO78_28148 [Psophocarpus tetragonolobus]|uniref:Uncharacterized protein n=1 Tax=Psophocarpus tetragonolobus TaxID=3891 RepID=A0AAN9S1U3_PSOTE
MPVQAIVEVSSDWSVTVVNFSVSGNAARFGDGGGVCMVREAKGFNEGNDNFYRHVQFLGRLLHRHFLSLRGFSIGRNHKRFVQYRGSGHVLRAGLLPQTRYLHVRIEFRGDAETSSQ